MEKLTISLQFFLVFIILIISTAMAASISKSHVMEDYHDDYEDGCEYEIVVNTGKSRGPNYKLWMTLTAKDGHKIRTSDMVGEWGDMSRYHTYFSHNSESGFVADGPCIKSSFCNIKIGGGKKGARLRPSWFINNVTVITRGEKIRTRVKTFHFYGKHHNVVRTNPPVNYGSCKFHH